MPCAWRLTRRAPCAHSWQSFAVPAAKAARRAGATPLDLTASEDAQLLSAKEFELCSTLRILPKAYLTMKEMMIQENNQQVRVWPSST